MLRLILIIPRTARCHRTGSDPVLRDRLPFFGSDVLLLEYLNLSPRRCIPLLNREDWAIRARRSGRSDDGAGCGSIDRRDGAVAGNSARHWDAYNCSGKLSLDQLGAIYGCPIVDRLPRRSYSRLARRIGLTTLTSTGGLHGRWRRIDRRCCRGDHFYRHRPAAAASFELDEGFCHFGRSAESTQRSLHLLNLRRVSLKLCWLGRAREMLSWRGS